MRAIDHNTITDAAIEQMASSLVVDLRENDTDASLKGIPSIRFDFRLARQRRKPWEELWQIPRK
jgi:hypothetical protein